MNQNLWNVIYNPKKEQYDLFFREHYITDFLDECEAMHMAYQLGHAYDTGYRKALEVVADGQDPKALLESLDALIFTEKL